MTRVNYREKLKRYAKNSFISFFRQGLAKDTKRNKEWRVYITTSDPDDDRTYWQGETDFENNYPCGVLVDFEGSKNRKYYLKDLRFAFLVAVDGVDRYAVYHFCKWDIMF
jgi:hypothetical protein